MVDGKRRDRWSPEDRNFKILHNLLMNCFPEWKENDPYWHVFEGIEDYFLDLEEKHHGT